MDLPESIGGVVCDVAAVVAVMADLVDQRKDSPGADLYEQARSTGTALAVPTIVAVRAQMYLDARGVLLLAAFLDPQQFRAVDDPLRATGPRGVWMRLQYRPERLPGYSTMLGDCGDPVAAYVAAYAAAMGWPVATDRSGTYRMLLGRDDAVVMPPLPG